MIKHSTYVYEAPKANGKEPKNRFQGKFTNKGIRYFCGNHLTLRQAQVAVDIKRIELGLKPIILKERILKERIK